MLKKLSAFLVAWHCLAICFSQPVQPRPVIITASLQRADSSSPRAMVFNFLNPFIRIRKSAAFDHNNHLSSSEEMIFTQNMTVMYNDVFINLVVRPGDSVHLLIDASRLNEKNFAWLTISGDNAAVSTEVNRWHHYFNTHYSKSFGHAGTLSAMRDSIRIACGEYNAILDSYAVANNIQPETRRWAATDIRYTVSYWAADYLTTKDSATGNLQFNHSLFSDAIFDQYNPNSFSSMMFPYHLGNYMYTLLKTDSLISRLQQQSMYRLSAGRALHILSAEPRGLSRDYLLFHLLNNYLAKMPQLLDSLPGVKDLFSNSVTYNYLKSAEARIRNPSLTEEPIKGMTFLDKNGSTVSIPEVKLLQYFSQRYPGRIIYLDIYATWCVPCLKEMKYMPALKAKVDTSRIVFINLCLQSEQNNWTAFVDKEKLQGENYFLPEDASKLFMGMYHIEGFPSYFLIGRNGKLNTDKAPRPSDEQAVLKSIHTLIKD